MLDIFICHASEDKADVAGPLAAMLVSAGLEVWYDEYSLELGDSIRQTIDEGLANSKYGVVILSPNFFKKDWPQAELDGLFSKEIIGQKTILPIWHNVDRDYVLRYSPILSDRVAALTKSGMDKVVSKILGVVAPESSFLTLSGKTLSVSPNKIRLHSSKWAVKTPLRINNLSGQPAYLVQVKLTLQPSQLNPSSIKVELDDPTTSIEEPVASVMVSQDAMIHFFRDADGRTCLAVVFHTIDPHTSREIQISGTIARKSSANVEIWDFKDTPPEALINGDKIAFPLSVPEDVESLGIKMLMRRR